MSTLTADPGFPRGSVLGILWKAYDAENGDGSNLTGCFKEFLDTTPTTGKLNSNRGVMCICVKNSSGGALLPGTVVKFKDGSLTEVDAAATTSSLRMGVVDEYLPAAGVANGEVFWLVVKGPSTVTKTTASLSAGAGIGLSATAGSAAAVSTNPLLGFALESTTTATSTRILLRTVEGY